MDGTTNMRFQMMRFLTTVLLACVPLARCFFFVDACRRPVLSRLFDCEPEIGDVVVYRRAEERPVEVGVVVAEMHCTQWIQPLKATSAASEEDVAFIEDEASDIVQVQGLCEKLLEHRSTEAEFLVKRLDLPETTT